MPLFVQLMRVSATGSGGEKKLCALLQLLIELL
ncbi:MAG: hypothetical protein BWY77_00860 [bacterium ADurb.Bin431]|nr:MAG: hypothetical protein BWY77_00860 [bacterium ADurb.Bin431]